MKRVILISLLFLLINSLIHTLFAQENTLTIITTQQNSNIRASASASGALVGVLNRGENAVVIGENPNGENVSGVTLWYEVRLANGIEGWVWSGAVSVAQVTPTPSPTLPPTLPPNEAVQSFESSNIQSFQPITQHPEAERGTPQRVAWSPDGSQMLIGTRYGIWLHDIVTQNTRQVAHLNSNTWSVFKVGFIPDTTSIFYVTDEEGTVHVFLDNVNTDTLPRKIRIAGAAPQGFASEYRNAFVSPDGKTLALVGTQIRLIGLTTATPDADIEDEPIANIKVDYGIGSLAFHPDSRQFAIIGSISGDGFHIEGYRIDDQSQLYRHRVRTTSARFLFFHPDGTQLTVAGDFMKFFNVDITTGSKSLEFGEGYAIRDAKLSPDGTRLGISVGGGGIFFYDTGTGESAGTLTDYDAPVSFDFSPDGEDIASVVTGFGGNYGGYLRVSDVATNTTRYRELFYAAAAYFDRTGAHIHLRTADQFSLYSVDNLDGEPLRTTLLPPWATIAVPSPDDLRFYLASRVWEGNQPVGKLQVWDAQTSQAVNELITTDAIRQVWAHPDNQHLMILLEDGDLSVRDAYSLAENNRLSHLYSDIALLKFSGNGQTFVTAGSGSTVAVWNENSQLLRLLDIPQEYRESDFSGWSELAINFDGSLVIASTSDRVFFWNGLTGAFIRQLPIGVSDIAIHPDDRTTVFMAGMFGMLFYDSSSGVLLDSVAIKNTNTVNINANGSLFLMMGEHLSIWGIPRQIEAGTNPEINILFQDDFESRNARRWDGIQGNPVIEEAGNHVLSLDNTSADYIGITPKSKPRAGHMILEARLRVMRTADQRDNSQFDFMFLQPDIGVGIYNMRQALWTANVFSRSGTQPYGFGVIDFHPPTDEWLNVRIETYNNADEGNVMKVFIDNRLVQHSSHMEGRWGEFTFSVPPTSAIQLDDVRIMEVIPFTPTTPVPDPTSTPTATPTPSPTPTATADPAVLFQDNFEDRDLAGWDLSFAADAVEVIHLDGNHVLSVTGEQDDFVSLGFLADLNGATVIESRMQLIDLGPNNGSVVFNLMSENPGHASGYSALVSIGGAALVDRNDNFRDIEPTTQQEFQMELNQWYVVRFEADSQTLNLSVDGVTVSLAHVDVNETGEPVFIFDRGMKVYLDDIVIRQD